MDHLQDLPKELIRSYLIHYGMPPLFPKFNCSPLPSLSDVEPADTKPDMKKQLRRLVTNILSGSTSRRNVPGGEGAPQIDRTATPGASLVFTGSATPATSSTPAPYIGAIGSSSSLSQSVLPSTEELIYHYNSLDPLARGMAQAFGIAPISSSTHYSSRRNVAASKPIEMPPLVEGTMLCQSQFFKKS